MERWKFLAKASMVVQDSLDYQATLDRVVRLAVPTLADWAAIALRGEDGIASWAASAHGYPERADLTERLRAYAPRGTDGHHPVLTKLHDGSTQLVREMDEEFVRAIAHDEAHLALLQELGPVSYLSTPMVARNRVFGSLVLVTTRDSGRRFGARDAAIARVTARRAARAIDHARLFTAAEHAARAREAVLAMVSHDLKNPLSTIMMATAFLLEDLVPADDQHGPVRVQLRAVGNAADRMHRLVGDLLDVDAIETGRVHVDFTRLAVASLFEAAGEMLGPLAARRGITLALDAPPAPLVIRADPDRLLQVLSNLAGNAFKFTPAGGRVTIAARREGDTAGFRVSDTGCGILPSDLPHVFDRFWQAPETASMGSGLGLAITRGLVEAHGGQIDVSSVPGEGTTFRFTVPLLNAEEDVPVPCGSDAFAIPNPGL